MQAERSTGSVNSLSADDLIAGICIFECVVEWSNLARAGARDPWRQPAGHRAARRKPNVLHPAVGTRQQHWKQLGSSICVHVGGRHIRQCGTLFNVHAPGQHDGCASNSHATFIETPAS